MQAGKGFELFILLTSCFEHFAPFPFRIDTHSSAHSCRPYPNYLAHSKVGGFRDRQDVYPHRPRIGWQLLIMTCRVPKRLD